jgi:hypothetical protein
MGSWHWAGGHRYGHLFVEHNSACARMILAWTTSPLVEIDLEVAALAHHVKTKRLRHSYALTCSVIGLSSFILHQQSSFVCVLRVSSPTCACDHTAPD